MTEAIVSAVVNKLADLLVDEVHSLRGVNSKVADVKVQLGQMQCFLKDAESRKKRGDERIKGWVRDVRNVAYEIEDAFDTFLVEANRRRLGFIQSRLLARRALGEKISKIQAKLGRISEGRTTFRIQDLSGDGDHSQSLLQTQPNSFKRRVLPDVDNSEVVGFEDEKGDIINLLLNGPSDQSRYVVSIVGSGGLGKTTLAQKVYTSSAVRNHFDSCIWITVSQDFNLLDVLKKIHQKLEQNPRLKGESKEDQIVFLLGEVNTLLKEKKYLIVLDDVWTEHVFTQFKTGLVDVGNGSRVLMTTRNLNVANYADSRGVYLLCFLSEEESLVLFLKKAIRRSNPSPECPEELKDLARKLVQRCKGLPLALIVLGGLLSSKPCTYREWSRVLERLDWHAVGWGECMEILATSYDDLPYLHKSCFRYLACFPEDYTIEAESLMRMWIAEGLIDTKNKWDLENYAEDYLEELVQRCLVQVVERSPDGAIMSIHVHDLLREVALGEATENDFLHIWKKENAEGDVRMTRRVAFHGKMDEDLDLRRIKMPKLRTFINFEGGSVIGTGFLLLRVLELGRVEIRDLPTDLKNMIHLRYLGLRGTKVNVIPSWIGHLKNLQTFNIGYTNIRELPEIFWKIPSLRHVSSPLSSAIVGPPSTANLVNLRSLGNFLVPKSWKKSFPHLLGVRKLQLYCGDENDGMLIDNLISKLNNLLSVTFKNFYPPRGMIDFRTSPSYPNIHTMYLRGYKPEDPPTVHIADMPINLAKLTLEAFRLNDDPMPKLEKLRGLKCLVLDQIRMEADTIVCTNGGFPRLQTLTLLRVLKMKEWKVEYGALPMLKYLLIRDCDDLLALPDLQFVTTLQQLEIDRELQLKIKNMSGVEWHKVKHIPTIIGSDPSLNYVSSQTKLSPPNSSSGKSSTLPADAAWGLCNLNSRSPETTYSAAPLQPLLKSKSEGAPCINTKQPIPSAWHDPLGDILEDSGREVGGSEQSLGLGSINSYQNGLGFEGPSCTYPSSKRTMGITLTHFLSLIAMKCSFLDSIYSSFLPPNLSSSINRMRELFSDLETVSTNLHRKLPLPDCWIVNAKLVSYAADQILCKLQNLLLDKDAAMASNLLGRKKKLKEVGSSSFSCFATDGFYKSFPSSSEIDDEINWIIRILEELLVSGEIKIGYSRVLTYINPGLSEQEVCKLLYCGNPSQPWSEKHKLLMKPSALMDVPESVNGFFNPIYNRRLRHASPFTLITSLHLSGLSDIVELSGLPVLHTLRISGCDRLNAVSICEKLSAVEALEISCCPELTSLTGLNKLLSLRSLSLSFCFNLQFDLHVQLPPLLEYLDLTHCPSFEECCKNAGLQNWKLDETIESFQRSSRVGDSPVYGRENEKNSIIEFLLSDDFNRNNLTVVCTVGESGIGKTSIVHLIYSEERVLDSFDARIFITMPEKSDETRLLNKLIESITGFPCPMTEADLLEDLLIDELSGTKVFVVLDDADNENPCFWNRIVTILNHSSRGSVLLVTTKSKDVAEVMGAMKTYYLDPLSDYYCWKIFWQHISTGLSTNANSDLVETGKRLVSKCQHNPLCIKVLAGLLVCSKNEESLVEILKTDLREIFGFDGDTLPILRVGYELLPDNLKKCLHYCSLFPKDYVFAKQQIVRMWMSQGFIIPVEGTQPEEVGLQNFDELLLRGFLRHSPVHDVEEDKFIMHDIIRAFATNLSRKKCPPADDALERIFENCFHFSLNPSKIQMDKMKPLKNSDLQSFLALARFSLPERINFSILDLTSLTDLFTKCINLRTLDLSCADIVELPSSVGMLKQLRYLGVNNTKIRSIPRALCSLVSLQTLEAKDCQHLVELPESMMELKNLRHLDVSKKSGCVKMMNGIGQLTNLQSLAFFCVGSEIPYCSIRELKDLNCLSSCLQIAGLENIKNGLDAKEAALHNKVHLNTLWLHWNDNRACTESEESVTISEEVLNNLKPNPEIAELIIRNYRGNLFPTWMGDPSMLKLVSIILDNCLNCSQFPALGGLPSLKHLSVQKLYHLVRLENADNQFGSKNTPKFPSLETLNLWEMYNLEELFETSDRDFPCLRTLSINRCPMLKKIPCFFSLLNLCLYCCVKLPYLPNLPSLESLTIDGFQKMKSLELPKDLPALKKLEIRHCNELLLVEGLPELLSLEKLNIVHCPQFDSFKSWKPCHSKSISTTRWFFPKEESTTHAEHEETLNLAEMVMSEDTYKGI